MEGTENELVQCSGNFFSIFSLKPAFFRQVFQTLIYEQTNFLIRTCNKVRLDYRSLLIAPAVKLELRTHYSFLLRKLGILILDKTTRVKAFFHSE